MQISRHFPTSIAARLQVKPVSSILTVLGKGVIPALGKMKCFLHIAAFSMLITGQALIYAEEAGRSPKNKLAADFGACPNGHKELKDVPIVWGHFKLFGKHPRDYTEQERELAAKRDRREIVFGGDILPQYPPVFRVVCDRCGFTFHPSWMTSEQQQALNLPADSDAYWTKDSKEADGFPFPFSKQLLSFPLLKADMASTSYSQTLSADGKRLNHEMIAIQSPLPIEQILEAVRNWLKLIDRNTEHLKRLENAFAHHTYQYEQQGISIHLRDDNHIDPGIVSVSLMITPNNAKP